MKPIEDSGRWGLALAMAASAVVAWTGAAAGPTTDIVVQAAPGDPGEAVSDAIDAALTKARALRHAQPGDAIRIVIRPGVYHLARPLTLGAADSGSAGAPLTLAAASAAPVRLLGSRPVAAIPAAGLARLARAAPGARARLVALPLDAAIVQAGLESLHRTHGVDNPARPVILIQGDNRLSLARWPRQGYAQADQGAASKPGPPPAPSFTLAGAARWAGEKTVWAGGFWSYGWAYDSAPVAGVTSAGSVQLAPLAAPYPLGKTFRFAVVNSAADIAGPGQFVLDDASHAALAWPFAPPSRDPVELAVLPNLLVVDGASDVGVSGIAFENAADAGVVISNSHRVSLTDDLVANVGGDGVRVTGGEDVAIVRSVVIHTGKRGVALAGGDRLTLTPARHRLSDSIVSQFGELMPTYQPGVALDGVGQTVERSYIGEGPHMGIGFSGNDHRIVGNELAHLVRDASDAGVIYAGRDVMARGDQIVGNYIHDIDRGPPPLRDVRGIYLDDFLSGVLVADNLMVGVPRSVFVNGGSDTTVQDNVFVAPADAAISIADRSRYWNTNAADLKVHGAAGVQAQALYESRYPGVSDAFGAVHSPRRNRTTGSVVVGPAPGSLAAAAMAFPPPATFDNGAWITSAARSPRDVCAQLRSAHRGPPAGLPCSDRLSQLRSLRYGARFGAAPAR